MPSTIFNTAPSQSFSFSVFLVIFSSINDATYRDIDESIASTHPNRLDRLAAERLLHELAVFQALRSRLGLAPRQSVHVSLG